MTMRPSCPLVEMTPCSLKPRRMRFTLVRDEVPQNCAMSSFVTSRAITLPSSHGTPKRSFRSYKNPPTAPTFPFIVR